MNRKNPRRQGVSNTMLVLPVSPVHSRWTQRRAENLPRKHSTATSPVSPSITYGRTVLRYMAHARSTGPKSNRINVSHSVAFLLMSSSLTNSSSEISATDARYPEHRGDLTCPFEYNFGDADRADVRTGIHSSMVFDDDLQGQDKWTRSPHNQLRSDPRERSHSGSQWTGFL